MRLFASHMWSRPSASLGLTHPDEHCGGSEQCDMAPADVRAETPCSSVRQQLDSDSRKSLERASALKLYVRYFWKAPMPRFGAKHVKVVRVHVRAMSCPTGPV